MDGLRVKDVNDLHINFQTQQTQVSNILVFFQHRQEIIIIHLKMKKNQGYKAQNLYRLSSQK
jgi:hypothetical protein